MFALKGRYIENEYPNEYPGRCPGLGYAALWLRPNFVSGLKSLRRAKTHRRASLQATPSVCLNYDLYDAHDFAHTANHVFHINHFNHSSDNGETQSLASLQTTPHPPSSKTQ
jgi:hypothetical protein